MEEKMDILKEKWDQLNKKALALQSLIMYAELYPKKPDIIQELFKESQKYGEEIQEYIALFKKHQSQDKVIDLKLYKSYKAVSNALNQGKK